MMTTADSIKQPILSPSAFHEKKEELILKEKSSDELSTRSSKKKEEAAAATVTQASVPVTREPAPPPAPVGPVIHKV